MTETKQYTITMREGTQREMTIPQMAKEFGQAYRLTQKRVSQSGWRSEALLRMSPEQSRKRNADMFRKVLSGEKDQRDQAKAKTAYQPLRRQP